MSQYEAQQLSRYGVWPLCADDSDADGGLPQVGTTTRTEYVYRRYKKVHTAIRIVTSERVQDTFDTATNIVRSPCRVSPPWAFVVSLFVSSVVRKA